MGDTKSGSFILIRQVVRRALVEICTVPVLLVYIDFMLVFIHWFLLTFLFQRFDVYGACLQCFDTVG